MKKFLFEDFTLIMTRDCNLACEYCPLDHFKGSIKNDILDIFFDKISTFNNHEIYITLFGGEPLLNREGVKYIYKILSENKDKFIKNNISITLKIVSNGTLLDKKYIELLKDINNISFVNLVINISIDGDKNTQLKQRNYKKGFVDYYDKLIENIHLLIKNDLNLELGMVMSFFNNDIFNNIVYLIKEFKIPVFIMPVDLTLKYIKNDNSIKENIRKYLINIGRTLKLLEKNNLTKYIVNYNNEYRDIKIPPIGPTIDIDGDIYTTRDFLFTMDKNIVFDTIGNIKEDDLIGYFLKSNLKDIEQKTLRQYYGRTFFINKKVGDYFTKLVYNK